MRPCSWHNRDNVRSPSGDTSAMVENLAGRSRDILVTDDREGAIRRLLEERLEIFKVLELLDLLRTQPRRLSLRPGHIHGIGAGGLSWRVSIAHLASRGSTLISVLALGLALAGL